MKERITFIQPADGNFSPDQLEVGTHALRVKSLKAAREDRLKFSVEELPHEIARVLQNWHQLHLRWVSEGPFPLVVPFLSTLSSGLHIFFTPQPNRTFDRLHPLFLKAFGENIKCTANSDKFISAPTVTSRFTTSSAFQCYEVLPSLHDFVSYIQQDVCPRADTRCSKGANRLQRADYLDIDYDAISRNLVLTSFHHKPPDPHGWDGHIKSHSNSSNTEVGLLTNEQAITPEELSLGGYLTVIGEDQKPNPTRFSFPSRYHRVPPTSGSTFHATFPPPTGLHPTLRLTFPSSSVSPPAPACGLHTYLTIPSPLFVDKYQLSSTNSLASKNLRAIRALSGETDLEAPDWVIQTWGSALLLEIAPPTSDVKESSHGRDKPWHAEIPLHLRYLSPAVGGTSDIEVPWPVVFWACPAEEGTKMNVNPFDRVDLGYESLFGPRTMFYHIQPQPVAEGGRLMEKVHVPVMDLQGTRWVEGATVGMVAIGAAWVFWKLLSILLRDWKLEEKEAPQRKTQ